jgi:hypothetical protein
MLHFASRLEVDEFVAGTDVERLRELVRGLDILVARKPVKDFSLADRQAIIALRRWRAYFRTVVGLKIEKHAPPGA